MLDAAYLAWQADTAAGRSSILIAETTSTVAVLNQRARTDRVDVEVRVESEPGRHRVDRRSDRHRHDPGVEVGTKLPSGLEAGEQLLQDPDGFVHVGVAVEATLPVRGNPVAADLDEGDQVVAVLAHEREARFDVGPQDAGAG
jgi:hypothetical protein